MTRPVIYDSGRRTYRSTEEAFPLTPEYACALKCYPRNTWRRRLWRFFVKPVWKFD